MQKLWAPWCFLRADDTHKHKRTHADRHPYPLSVSWPRRRTRCTSLWSTAPVKRLAWYGPSPVWLQVTWTTDTDNAAHPSSTWARFPDAIGRPGYPPFQQLAVWFSNCQINQGRAEKLRPGSGPSPAVDCRWAREERKWKVSKHIEHTGTGRNAWTFLTHSYNTSPVCFCVLVCVCVCKRALGLRGQQRVPKWKSNMWWVLILWLCTLL